VSAPAASVGTVPWGAFRRPAQRALPSWTVPAAAVLLGAAIAFGNPIVIAVALLPAAAALVLRPDGAAVIFAFGIYLNLPVVLANHAGISTVLASGFALVLLVPLFGYLVVGRQPVVLTPALGLMVGYLVALVLSATLAPGAGRDTVSTVVTFLSEGLLLYVLITNVVRTPRTLRAVVWALIVAGGIMGALSVWQEATHSYHQTLWGLAQVDRTGSNIGTAAAFGKDLRPRLAGPIGEKNRYAQVLLVLLPLALWIVRIEAIRWRRLLAAGCAFFTLCGILLTFSRGAALALGITVLAMMVVGFVRARTVALLLVCVLGLTFALAPDYIARLQSLSALDSATSQGSSADGAVVGRATEGLAAFNAFKDHPIVGVGPGQFFRRYSQEYGNQLNLRFLAENRQAHNLYLAIMADTGILGLVTFLSIVLVTIVQLWRLNVFWRMRRPEHAHLALAFLLSLVAYLASGAFLQLAYQRYFFVLVALANATIWVLRREARRLPDGA
jgi:putative inorganic carbon (HCO3(-)) transporter